MDDEEGAIDWPKVFLTLILATGMIGGGVFVYKARKAAALKAATEVKDYKGLFTQRGTEPQPIADPNALPATKPSPYATSSIMLQVDPDFKAPVVVKSTEPAPPVAAAAPEPAKPQPKTVAAPAKPAYKPFVKPSLNSGAFSRLNGGSGMGMSGGGMSGGGGGAAPAPGAPGGDPNAAAAAAAIGAAGAGGAPGAAGMPDISAMMQQAQQKK